MNEKTISPESEIKYIPECDLEQWQREIIKLTDAVLSQKNKAIINIAGASASGKGEAAEFLIQQLNKEGKKTLVISTDDFYKGVSRMIIEKLLPYFSDTEINLQEIEQIVRNITADKKFSEKFSEQNLQFILAYLKEKYSSVNSEQIIAAIKNEFQNIDFDNPTAVDLESIAEVLDKIKRDQEVEIPAYSMVFSEPSEKKKLNGADYDIVLVEGIYGLNEKIVEQSDIKTFIEADKRTLLMRRFRRDVLLGRTSFPPEIALWINLEIVLPAYNKHILPDRRKSDLILKNDYTGVENFDTETYDVQDKIFITEEDVSRLEEILGKPVEAKNQKDFYFTNDDEIFNPEHLIRIREEDGRLKDLVHKGARIQRDDGKIIRPTETYIKGGEFGVKYKNAEEVINAFIKAGFKLAAEISKIRKIYKKDNIEIALDQVEGLGVYVEVRTNDKLSKSPEIDKFRQELGLSERKSAGPYADEYFARIQSDPEKARQQEIILNQGLNREIVLNSGACETIETNREAILAFENLRRGYPEKSLSLQCKGKEFRENADIILELLAKKTIEKLDLQRVVVLMPWRSGLAFAESYRNIGVENFYHLSSKRDEKTLATVVDFESGKIVPDSFVIIADPMLATGNTIVDAIERALSKGVSSENIIINSVLAAPTGVQKIKKLYPEIRIITGSLDEKLDHRGYIVPGLGDFGDKYFANLSPKELEDIVNRFDINEDSRKKMIGRIKKQGASEVMAALMERDYKDAEIDELNKKELTEKGLERQKSKREIAINTGRPGGIENILEIIKSNIDKDIKIISFEGGSGTGKSTVTKELGKEIDGQIFSMGEIFRYLTYRSQETEGVNFTNILNSLSYKIVDGNLKLFDGELNVSDEFFVKLRDKVIEEKLPEISALAQEHVIRFSQRQISNLRNSFSGIVLIEGRSFTLDFLPSDLRVKLIADPSIRAERRWAQEFFKS